MKAYRVITGMNKDSEGYNTTERAEYFFNKEDAEKRYKEGEFTLPMTQITTTFSDGSIDVGVVGACFYEKELQRAKPNEKVELVTKTYNDFRIEVIEIN